MTGTAIVHIAAAEEIDLTQFAAVHDLLHSLCTGTDKVSLIQADFFKAGSTVTYVNDATVYYEISATGMAVVDGLPEVEKDEAIQILKTFANANPKVDAVASVYFTVVDAE